MKTLKIAFLLLFAVAGISARVFAQSEETRSVSGFNGIASSGSFTIHVKIDGTESLKMRGNAEDLRDIETVVENGVLQVRFPKHYDWGKHHVGHIDVLITAKALSSVSLGGSGSIDVEGVVKGNKVAVSVGGSGDITTAVESDRLDISIAGSGNIRLTGKANASKISIAGSGNLKAPDIRVNDADIEIAGSGDVQMGIEKTISAHIAGSGSVRFSGNASVTNVSSAGSGRVTRI